MSTKTVGIIGLTLGGIIGGFVAAHGGLKKWIWPMAWSISLTCGTFCYLAIVQPSDMLSINACVFVEQFGYGFGFTAYMLYLIYFSEGPFRTAHYAICTGFMALGMMLPGMAAGWLGNDGLCQLLLVGDGMLHRHDCRYRLHKGPASFGRK